MTQKDAHPFAAPSEKTVNALLRQARTTKKEQDKLGGSLREKIGYAKDKEHLHTKAFSHLRQIDRMEPEEAAEYWRHLNLYMDQTGITKRIDDVANLPLGDREETDDEQTGKGRKTGKPGDKVSQPKLRTVEGGAGRPGPALDPNKVAPAGAKESAAAEA